MVVCATFKYDDLRLKMSHEGAARVRHFQPRVHHIWMLDSLLCIICIISNFERNHSAKFSRKAVSVFCTHTSVCVQSDELDYLFASDV